MPQDPLVREIDRWKRVASIAVAVIALVIAGGFALERRGTQAIKRSGNILLLITNAQDAVWKAESAARATFLADPPGDAQRAVLRERMAAAHAALRALDSTVADRPDQRQQSEILRAGFARWEREFAAPALAGIPLSRDYARAGTAAFIALVEPLDALRELQRERRELRFRQQSAIIFSTVSIALAALALAAVALGRITAGLRVKAEEGAERQRVVEEQATELELQAQQLEEQAGQLEAQTASLEEKVAERDSTLALLEETSRFLDAAIDASPYGIAFHDRRLRFLRINKVLAAINGQPPEAHIGKTVDQILPGLAPTVRAYLEQVLASGEPITNLVIEGATPAAPTATRRWVVTYYPIPGPQQSVAGVGVIMQDVTEQHQTEQQLRQAQKLEAVGRLAGGIAHDFNNVLTVIQSYAEVLSFELEERGEAREEIDAIRAAADRAAGLARQLLAFSRRDVIIPRDVDLRDVILGMQLILRRLVPAQVELQIDLVDAPLVVRIDAGQLEQVLMNLCINAVDAMPEGGTLTLRTMPGAAGPDGRAEAVLEVTDTGTGMTDAVRERLFEPFFTTKPAGRGTGLGLATSYAIVHEANGRIEVTSALGAGSRFRVVLPQADPATANAARRATPVRGIDVAGGNERILMAEDEPAIRTAIARILRAAGYDVLEAANGAEALQITQTETRPIHLLLSDVMMPVLGGKDLVQRLAVAKPDLRVVLMSGYTDDAALRADLGAARYAFLQKPFTAREVLLAVRTALDAG